MLPDIAISPSLPDFSKYPKSVEIRHHLIQYLQDPTHDPSLSSAWTRHSLPIQQKAATVSSLPNPQHLEASSACV